MLLEIAVFAPLLGSILTVLLRASGSRAGAVWSSVALMAISAVAAVAVVVRHLVDHIAVRDVALGAWIHVGHFVTPWSLREDTLSLVVVVMVSVVSALIHLYSVGYMAHDRTMPRFFVYISAFTFAMLMLVTANNLLQLFFGWEGVGLFSYLLIGYWYDRASANAAAIKAFVMNRVGDLAFLIGIVLIYAQFGSVSFNQIFAAVPKIASHQYMLFGVSMPVLDVIGVLLFIGAMGKSAQIFLHTWLADAMEGPTPISALIHAATMVAAGVYMIVRMSPLISAAPGAMGMIAVIGGTTALFAGTIGCVQNDIKRIIAYSTCSQLGYMFLGAGVGADQAAIFHMVTHAMFKALLFLAAGSVIHAMADEQDVRKMGGLWRKMKITYVTMLIGSLALAAIPPFAGYYSKDAILAAAFANHGEPAMFGWVCGVLGAGLTAFYISRLMILTFHGAPRGDADVHAHVHESGWTLLVPLLVLALGASFGGMLLDQPFVGAGSATFWGSSIVPPANMILQLSVPVPAWAADLPLLLALVGFGIAYVFYVIRPSIPATLAEGLPGTYRFLLNKWYFDELYDYLFVQPSKRLARVVWRGADDQVIDGVPTGLARWTADFSVQIGRMQNGSIAVYSFVMLLGLLVLLSLFLMVR
jgi:NADH-quinone oxidoreductase subunit L